jgi:hypothetical protein
MCRRSVFAHRQRQAISAHHTDQRRAAGVHVLDHPCGVIRRAQGHGLEDMRQLGLVDDAKGILADGPDRAVMLALIFMPSTS